MKHRFHRVAAAAAPSTGADAGEGRRGHESGRGECRCCAALRRAREGSAYDSLPEWRSALTPGVQLVNLSHSEDGACLRVDLSEDWARMFSQLPLCGEGLITTRTTAAILGRRMRYPALTLASGGGKGASGEGGLWVDFRRLGAGRALHLRRESGHVFGAEFADESGSVVHRFTLTAGSSLDEFLAWVRLHQACAAHPGTVPWCDEEDEPRPGLEPHAFRRSDAGALTFILAACLEREVPVRVTVRTGAVIQQVEFTPQSLRLNEHWWFASDDLTGLHFQPQLFAQVALEQHTTATGTRRVCVQARGEEAGTAMTLEAGQPEHEPLWREVVEATA